MLNARSVIDRSNLISGTPAFTEQGLDGLNIVLGDLCEDYDFALSRGEYNFTFDPGLSTLFGSGPYPLPLDYLRTSGSSGAEGQTKSAWFLYPAPSFPSGQPMPLVPVDLGRFDQYPQMNAQGIPGIIATDMGGPLTQRITLVTTAATMAASAIIRPLTGTPAVGQGCAGEGIAPGSIVSAVATSLVTQGRINSNTTVDNLNSTTGVQQGDAITGSNIPADTVVVTVDSATQVTISQAATASTVGQIAITFTYTLPIVTLSAAATATLADASVFFGIYPVCYVYPPPNGSWPVTIRYQRKMPPIQNTERIPWFPNESYLIERLAAAQMQISGDQRLAEFEAMSKGRLTRYADLSDDKTNRAQTIQLDPSRYGPGAGGHLKITKSNGW